MLGRHSVITVSSAVRTPCGLRGDERALPQSSGVVLRLRTIFMPAPTALLRGPAHVLRDATVTRAPPCVTGP
jgi:hypothetical protein